MIELWSFGLLLSSEQHLKSVLRCYVGHNTRRRAYLALEPRPIGDGIVVVAAHERLLDIARGATPTRKVRW